MSNRRPHPHLAIPSGANPPSNAPAANSWNFVVSPPERDSHNLWADSPRRASFDSGTTLTPTFPQAQPYSPSRPSSLYASPNDVAFPEPQLYRSSSHKSLLRPTPSLGHRSTKSDVALVPNRSAGGSRPPSFVDSSPEFKSTPLSDELSNLTLASEDGLRRFQANDLPDNDEQWYRLVPPEAQGVLDKMEFRRQSLIFEVIKTEKDYVNDLELLKEVYVDPLINTSPLPHSRLKAFVADVFYNLDDLIDHHRRMLGELYRRQREQHPLIQSIADIILENSLLFRPVYEKYIQHYPISKAHHANELRRNPKYQFFISQCAHDPRLRKHEFSHFLHRPVSRLPRVSLLLQEVLKNTAADHPDQETLPLVRGLMNEFIKGTEPGVEASEDKVKFWELCESLVYQKGEIIDLDLYDESRTLFYSGTLARHYRVDVGYRWADLHVALLDNYLLLLQSDVRASGLVRYRVISRPIPLEYLQLATTDGPPETRKDKGNQEALTPSSSSASNSMSTGRLFGLFRSEHRQVYPFTVYHASAKLIRRYTLYAATEPEREKWKKCIRHALEVRRVRQESNMWFAPHAICETLSKPNGSGRSIGKVVCATSLTSGGKNFIAIGSTSGVYVSSRSQPNFKRILNLPNVTSLHALQDFNKFLVHSDAGIYAYSLDILARVAQSAAQPQMLDASLERVCGQDVAVVFARVAKVGSRTMLLYTTKSFLQVTLHALEIVNPSPEVNTTMRKGVTGSPSFRPLCEPASVPKDTHDVKTLHKNIAICTERSILIADPLHLSVSTANPTSIPNFSGAEGNAAMHSLKERCAGAKPLGLVRCDNDELLVIFDELGCYITRHGNPARNSGYLRWETKADSYAHRGEHVLLFSADFVEVRKLSTGRLVQVVKGRDMRLVHASEGVILAAMRGADAEGGGTGAGDKLVELVQTAEIGVQQQQSVDGLWDDWDM